MKDADVRKFVFATGVILVLLGVAWRFAGWIVEPLYHSPTMMALINQRFR